MKKKVDKIIDKLVQATKNKLSDKKGCNMLDGKRKKTLSTLRVLADGNNVEAFFSQVANALLDKFIWSPVTQTTMPFTTSGKKINTLLCIYPEDSSSYRGLALGVWQKRIAEYLGIPETKIMNLIEKCEKEPWKNDSYKIWFQNFDQVKAILYLFET